MIISHNLSAINAHRIYQKNTRSLNNTLERLSTGLRISKAADDAAGLSISEKMRAQIKGLRQASRNAQDSISLIQTADGAINEMNSAIDRMRELAVQAANDTLTDTDRLSVNQEFEQLKDNLDRISQDTEFNGKKLLNGMAGATATSTNSKIKLYSTGSLEDIEGDYKINTSVVAGKGQVQQSAIMLMKNGTTAEDVKYSPSSNKHSGIEGFSSKNLLPEDYRIQTREEVLGGINYHGTSGITNVDTTGTPDVVANGSYDIVTADEVPFMATYADSQTGPDIVTGAHATGRSDIDVKMDITENTAPVNSQSEIAWKDIGGAGGGDIRNAAAGGDVAFQTKANNANNVYTHFNVQGTDTRDLLGNDINVKTSYKAGLPFPSNAGAYIYLNYKTQETSEAKATLSYESKDSETAIAMTTRIFDGATGSNTTTITIDGDTFDVSGMNIEEAANNLDSHYTNISFTRIGNAPGTSQLVVTNNTGGEIDISNTGTNIGISGTLVHSFSKSGNIFDYKNDLVFNLGNMEIGDIATAITTGFNTEGYNNIDAVVVDNTDGTKHLRFNNTSNYEVEFIADGNTDSVEAELGFNGAVIKRGDVHNGTDVFDQHQFTFDISSRYIRELDDIFRDKIVNETVNGVSIDPSHFYINDETYSAEPGCWELEMASLKYKLDLTDSTGSSLNELGLVTTLSRNDGAFTYSNSVYHDYSYPVWFNDQKIDEIATTFNNELNYLLSNDELTKPLNNKFEVTYTPGEARIDINNTDTGYTIRVSENQVTDDLGISTSWADFFSMERTETQTGNYKDFNKSLGTITAGQNIEEIKTTLDNMTHLSSSWSNPNYTPGYDGTHHEGRLTIGVSDSTIFGREVVFSGGGENQLFGSSDAVADKTNNIDSDTWQARDRVYVRTVWHGVSNTGNTFSGACSDWWWEGDDGTTNPLITSHPQLPFSSIYIPDNDDDATELTGSWCMYTSASSGSSSDQLDFELVDEQTGSSYSWGGAWGAGALAHNGGGRYVLNDGVLDDSNFRAPQMIRTGAGSYTSVTQNVDFGTISAQNNALVYKERYSDPSYNHEAYASYGDDATYFFANMDETQSPTDYIQACEVWPQETDNVSILFQVKSLAPPLVQVEGKGYNRDGSDSSFGPLDITLNPMGGPVEIGSVQFDDLQLGGNLSVNDKFVVNVAARAGTTNAEVSHGDTTYTDSNVAINGNPFEIRGSTMEYRFDQGVEDGKTLNLLGYFVHPLTGGTETGVMTGSIKMQVSGTGFTSGTQVTGNQGTSVDINYYGRSDKKAGALITHYHFSNLTEFQQPNEIIDEIRYEPTGDYNASILFDVAETSGDHVVFHVQAHTYDTQGNYRYFEDDYVKLNKTNDGLSLFTGENFNGLKFDTFSFEDMSQLTIGDRFVVNTGADTSDKPGSDEITSFTDSFYGSMYPGSWRFEDGVLDNSQTQLKFYQIEPQNCPSTNAGNYDIDDGRVFDGEMTFRIGDFHGGTVNGLAGSKDTPLEVKDAVEFSSVWKEGVNLGVAHKYTYLEDIANLYDSTKGFLLEDNQTLKINYKGQEKLINLNPNQTIRELLDGINRVVYEDFEQKEYVDEDEKFKFANYVNQPDETGETEQVKGAFVIRSAVTGEDGEIRLSGNQVLLDILEMIETQKAQENICNLEIKDATTGDSILKEKLQTGSGTSILHSNLQIDIDSDFGLQNTRFD